MTWNYRIIKTETIHKCTTYTQFGIHEVYYDENHVPQGHTERAIELTGESVLDIKTDLEYMQIAFTKPVLFYVNGAGYVEL